MSDENPTPADDGEERNSSVRRANSSDEGSPAADDRTSEDRGTAESADPTEAGDGEPDAVESDDREAEVAGDGRVTDDAADAADESADADADADASTGDSADAPPTDVQKYARFKKMDGAEYDRVNEFLRDRTYVTAREWAIARLCADFRTETGVEMTKIGNNLPELVPFMTDTYTPQAVNQARSSFEGKVRKSGATFLYGAMSGFFTAEELDELMYEVSEIAKFLLEVEGVDLSVEDELEAEERISSVMREVRRASAEMREEELTGDGDSNDD